MGPSLAGIVVGFVVIGAVLRPVEKIWPAVAGQPQRRRGLRADVASWFFTPGLSVADRERREAPGPS